MIPRASANRDAEAFPILPIRCRSTAQRSRRLRRGRPQFCLGANLARMELRLLFTELVTLMPRLELDGPVEMLRSNFVGGIKHMPVRW